ncbi:hypothetical protein IFM89_029248 [Coptis chinensis]|uniref:Uncharacterized protein n=1 Tax=Coptis chinensis TaxID=261450 RepID=A0A835LCX0_9MAGN|nr:hypothetical protein IFM89_029248 [Coptis chinensis]
MTAFVQNLLQQMQARFQTMSENIVSKNILFSLAKSWADLLAPICQLTRTLIVTDENHVEMLTGPCFFGVLNCNALDDMGSRIDELEQSINDLRTEMGVENSPPPVPKTEGTKPADGSA